MPRGNKKKKKQKQKKQDNRHAVAIGSNGDNTLSSSEAASSTPSPDQNTANTHIKIIIIKFEDSKFVLFSLSCGHTISKSLPLMHIHIILLYITFVKNKQGEIVHCLE